jgi:hypothetical protein
MIYGKQMLSILDKVSIFDLGNDEGCMCLHFNCCAIQVDISCHKSGGGRMFKGFSGITTRISSRHLCVCPDDLEMVAHRIVELVHSASSHSNLLLRYCDWECDNEKKCSYCNKKGREQLAYLCEECLRKKTPFGESVASRYDYRKIEFPMPLPEVHEND